jgi:hypothetical protein
VYSSRFTLWWPTGAETYCELINKNICLCDGSSSIFNFTHHKQDPTLQEMLSSFTAYRNHTATLYDPLKTKLNSVALVRKRTMLIELPPLVEKVVPIFADRGCRVSAQRIPTVVNLDFLDRSRYFFFKVAPQLSSRGWVDPVPDPLILRKSGSPGNRSQDFWICSQKLWPLDHRDEVPNTVFISIPGLLDL